MLKLSIFSFSFFPITISLKRGSKKITMVEDDLPVAIVTEDLNRPVLTLVPIRSMATIHFHRILYNQTASLINVYLMIELKPTSAYNLVMPVIEIPITGQIFFFDRGCYALQGNGGGFNQLEAVVKGVKLFRDTGKAINLIAKVAHNKFIKQFEKDITAWEALKQNSTVLENVISEQLAEINIRYVELQRRIGLIK